MVAQERAFWGGFADKSRALLRGFGASCGTCILVCTRFARWGFQVALGPLIFALWLVRPDGGLVAFFQLAPM